LYVPKGYEKHDGVLANLPLVVFLHGSGSRGINNLSQLNSNPSALEFVRPEAQTKHPCFVLAPQNPKTLEGWANNVGTNENQKWVITPQLEAIKTIIDNLIKSYNIDTARIYGTGLSQGSKGIMRLSIDYPELYAAQLNSAGYDVYTDEEIAKIRNKPTWQLIAVDDTVNSSKNTRRVMEQFDKAGVTVVRMVDDKGWNGFLRGHGAEVRAQEQWDAAKAANAHVLYTEYLPATIEPSRHWSWQATYANAVIREWLFSQVNPTPYSTK
jgi:predicted peptidase